METETIGPEAFTNGNVICHKGVNYYRDHASSPDLAREVASLRETQESLLIVMHEIRDAVGPLLDSLKDSPILKMLGVK